jgi:hypothetical protein
MTQPTNPRGLELPELLARLVDQSIANLLLAKQEPRLIDQSIVNLLLVKQELLTHFPPEAPDFTLPRLPEVAQALSPAPQPRAEPAPANAAPANAASKPTKAANAAPKGPASGKPAPASGARGAAPAPAPDRRITPNPARHATAEPEFQFPRLAEATSQEARMLGWRGVVRQILADASESPHGRINTKQIREAYCKTQGLDPAQAQNLPEKVKNQIYIHTHELRKHGLLKKDEDRNGTAVITAKGREELQRLTRELEAQPAEGAAANEAAEAERPAFG